MTSHSEEGGWLAHGWKDGLRIVSEVVEREIDIEEPAVWIREERDYHLDSPGTNKYAVDLFAR